MQKQKIIHFAHRVSITSQSVAADIFIQLTVCLRLRWTWPRAVAGGTWMRACAALRSALCFSARRSLNELLWQTISVPQNFVGVFFASVSLFESPSSSSAGISLRAALLCSSRSPQRSWQKLSVNKSSWRQPLLLYSFSSLLLTLPNRPSLFSFLLRSSSWFLRVLLLHLLLVPPPPGGVEPRGPTAAAVAKWVGVR